MANLNNPSNALYLNDSTGQPVAVSTTNPMPVTVSSDIEIGAVEIKNGSTDTRATVLAASTAAQATDTALVVAQSPNTPLPAGTNNLGNVGGKTVSVTVTPTVTASNAYGTNYVVGGLLTFANAFTSKGSGVIQSVTVTCKKVETSGFTFFPFNANPSNTTWTDAAVANINAADVSAMRNPIALSANSQLGTCTVLSAVGLGQATAPGSTSLYGVLIANGALTNQFGSTSDITVTVTVLQDV